MRKRAGVHPDVLQCRGHLLSSHCDWHHGTPAMHPPTHTPPASLHNAAAATTTSRLSSTPCPRARRSPVISPALVPLPPEQVGSGFSAHLHSYEHAYPTDSCRAVVGETKHRLELYVDMFVKVRGWVELPSHTQGCSICMCMFAWSRWAAAVQGAVQSLPLTYCC